MSVTAFGMTLDATEITPEAFILCIRHHFIRHPVITGHYGKIRPAAFSCVFHIFKITRGFFYRIYIVERLGSTAPDLQATVVHRFYPE